MVKLPEEENTPEKRVNRIFEVMDKVFTPLTWQLVHRSSLFKDLFDNITITTLPTEVVRLRYILCFFKGGSMYS